ncbi:MAG: hypothetical protein LBG94_09590 [Treponema sp.]|jgi:hypothetical protein|nr:hypothetical protein [Treponema sp.]
MKHIVRILGVIAVSALTVFTMSVCDDGGNKAQTVTYEGLGYTLRITENANRAYSPVTGDNYELKANGKTSKGTVTVNDAVFTLKPSNSATTFTITISGAAISAISGTITWNDNTATPVGGTLTITNFSSILTNTNNYVYAQALIGEYWVAFVSDNNPVPDEAKLGKIPASGSIVLNAYQWYEGVFSIPFTGNGIAIATELVIAESNSNIISSQFQFGNTVIRQFENTVPITFTNGNATVNFSTQMELYVE